MIMETRSLGYGMDHERADSRIGIALLLVTMLGCVLRLIRLGADSIWYDEAVSLLLASKDISAMLAHTAGDIHPPLYYALLHLWTLLLGSTEFSAGLFSTIWGILLIPLAYVLGKQVAAPRVGVLAAFLVAISPYHIWYSQELRMYTLGACLGLLALLGLRRAVRSVQRRWIGWGVYAVCAAAGLYTLYYFVFLLIAINVWAIIALVASPADRRWRMFREWGVAQIATLLLYLPWLPTVWRQIANPPVPPWREAVAVGPALSETWTALSFGQSVEVGQVWPLLLAVLALTLWGGWRLARQNGADAALLAGYLLLPLALILLISVWIPLYHVRYIFTYSPPFYVLLAIGLLALLERQKVAGVLAAAVLLGGTTFSLWQYQANALYAPDDHRGAVEYLNAHWRPGDAVLINAGYVYPTVTYYNQLPIAWRGRLTDYGIGFTREQDPAGLILLQTGSVDATPDLGWGSPESDFYATDREETTRALERVFRDYERVWVYRCYDTVTDPKGSVRSWLDDQGIKFDETPAFTGRSFLRVQGYLTERSAVLPAEAERTDIVFGGRLELAALSASMGVDASDLSLALWWRALDGSLPRLAVTARLADEAGVAWSQTDEQPLGSAYNTTVWPGGVYVRHPVMLPIPTGLLPGVYRVQLGVYEAESGAVWLIASGDSLPIVAEFTVSASRASATVDAEPLVVFGDRIALLAARVNPGTVLAGWNIELELLWHARRAIDADLVAFAQLLDRRGTAVAHQESPPANGRSRTSAWAVDELLRERRTLHVPADLAAGSYRLILGWYDPVDGSRLAPEAAWPWQRRDHLVLNKINVTSRTPQLDMPLQPDVLSETPMADGIELAGYSLDSTGASVDVTLIWRATGPIAGSYSVYCHLQDVEKRIWGQADSVPVGGAMPTLNWMAGEYVLDHHVVALQADAPAGEYHLIVGLYDPSSGALPGESLDLGAIEMSP